MVVPLKGNRGTFLSIVLFLLSSILPMERSPTTSLQLQLLSIRAKEMSPTDLPDPSTDLTEITIVPSTVDIRFDLAFCPSTFLSYLIKCRSVYL
jgi:hypothetical protein